MMVARTSERRHEVWPELLHHTQAQVVFWMEKKKSPGHARQPTHRIWVSAWFRSAGQRRDSVIVHLPLG